MPHYDVIKWKHFPRHWRFVRGIYRWPVNSPHKGQWGGALMFSLICAWINGSVNNREAGDLRSHGAHYKVIVMHNGVKCVKNDKQYTLLKFQWISSPKHDICNIKFSIMVLKCLTFHAALIELIVMTGQIDAQTWLWIMGSVSVRSGITKLKRAIKYLKTS